MIVKPLVAESGRLQPIILFGIKFFEKSLINGIALILFVSLCGNTFFSGNWGVEKEALVVAAVAKAR